MAVGHEEADNGVQPLKRQYRLTLWRPTVHLQFTKLRKKRNCSRVQVSYLLEVVRMGAIPKD